MLQFLRGHASSWVMKIILGLILLSFGVWGISGLFVGHGQQVLVAKVGKVEISKQYLLHEVQRRLQTANRELKNTSLTLEQAIKLGIPAKILDDLIRKILIEQELNSLHLTVTEGTLSSMIFSDPTFKNEKGRFDGEKFKKMLANNGLTEAQYMAHRVKQIVEAQFMTGITAGSKPAGSFSLLMFNDLFEERALTLYTVDKDALKKATSSLQTADTKALRDYYEAHKDAYKSTEKRAFSVLVLDPKTLEHTYTFSEKEIQAAYEQQLDNYAIPEKRDLQVYTDTDWRKVKIAHKLLEKGASMPADSRTNLYRMDQETLSDKLGQEAFDLKEGEFSDVFKSEEGFQVVKVVKIIPATTKPLSHVRLQVIGDLKRQKAMDEMATLTQTIEDSISGGVSLEDVAKAHHLQLIHAAPTVAMAKKNTLSAGIQEPMVKTAFEQEVGETGPVVELEDGVAYVVRVDQVDPSQIQSFEKVQESVKDHLLRERMTESVEKKTAFILNQGMMPASHIHALQKDPSVRAIRLPVMNYIGSKDHPEVTSDILSAAWPLTQGQGARVTYRQAPAVVCVEKITPATVERKIGEYTGLKNEIAEMLNRDLLLQYFDALKIKHDVTIYEDIMETLAE